MLLARLAAIVAPPLCAVCRGATAPHSPLCRGCRLELPWLGADTFDVRGTPAWAPLGYEGPARALVRALKFRGALPLAGLMAAQMAAGAPRGLVHGRTLVPVPLHPARRRRRGFDQAAVLATALGPRLAAPVESCLRRVGTPGSQVGRARVDRLTALADAFAVRPGRPPPDRVLLVDDVVTTGATIAACAAALRAAGTADVSALAYARTRAR